jgi:hypothetical protein
MRTNEEFKAEGRREQEKEAKRKRDRKREWKEKLGKWRIKREEQLG